MQLDREHCCAFHRLQAAESVRPEAGGERSAACGGELARTAPTSAAAQQSSSRHAASISNPAEEAALPARLSGGACHLRRYYLAPKIEEEEAE